MSDAPGLLCVHAHPDDEVISTGGVLLRAAAAGWRTDVITCTGGERGEFPGLGPDANPTPEELGEIRVAELREGLKILGAGEPRWLGYRDTGMVANADGSITPPEDAGPDTFWHAPFDEAVGRLVAHIRELRPSVLVTYDPFGGYGHPDHLQAHRVSVCAVEAAGTYGLYADAGEPWRTPKVYYSTFPRSMIAATNAMMADLGLPSPFGEETDPAKVRLGTPDELVTTTVDVADQLAVKMAALRAHTSQLAPDSFFLNIPEPMQSTAFAVEWFSRLRSDVGVPDPEDDLLTGIAW